eukprot:693746-Pyramimonas_sp.AAC.1
MRCFQLSVPGGAPPSGLPAVTAPSPVRCVDACTVPIRRSWRAGPNSFGTSASGLQVASASLGVADHPA